jgi:lipopolysaccharide/colanic/teichoic acid biosynthesis glycosyltransferase
MNRAALRARSKRAFDVVFAAFGLLALAPVGALIALLVKLSDGGPVFFAQTRVGRGGRPFRIWKFRSMFVNADKAGLAVTSGRDPRVTWIGRILRRTKLDELPQLWNVLVGEMSFVGPRPEVPRYVQFYTPEQRAILELKPGITDMATLLFRKEEELLAGATDVEGFYVRHCLPRKIELNLEYARRATLPRDIWIIFQTLVPYWVTVLALYAVVLTASSALSHLVLADFAPTAADREMFLRTLPWLVGPQLICLLWQRQARALLSYFSIPEMTRTAVALAAAVPFQAGLAMGLFGDDAPPASVFVMDGIMALFAICGVRMSMRLFRERVTEKKDRKRSRPTRVAIIGAGETATSLALDLIRSRSGERRVVAFFDDDPRTWQKRPYDIPVFGMPECLLNPEWHSKIDEVIVATAPGNADRARDLRRLLDSLPVRVTTAVRWPMLETSSTSHDS